MRKNLSKFLNKRIQVIGKVKQFGKRRAKKTLKIKKTILLTNIKIINLDNGEEEGYERHLWIDYNKTYNNISIGDTVLIEGYVKQYKKNNKQGKYSKYPIIKKVKINYSLDNTYLVKTLNQGVSS